MPEDSRVLVGVSGGSDSVALLRLLLDLSEHGRFKVVGCAHLNHELRPNARRDEQFCCDLATRWRVPIQTTRISVQSYAFEQRLSLEEAARTLRYEFLEQVAATMGAERIAVGHTQDDQAETFLLKLIRGASQTGLGGVYPRRGAVVRPLLAVSRTELRRWLAATSEPWIEDETNEDLANPRNRIRHQVLPALSETLGGDPKPAIARAATHLREDGEWLEALAESEFDQLVEDVPGGIALSVASLIQLPRPILSRVLRKALQAVSGGREVGLIHVESARAVLEGRTTGADVPAGHVERVSGLLVVAQRKQE